MLQQQPDLVYQFYSDVSTMVRIDGSKRDTAAAMLVIYYDSYTQIQFYVYFYMYIRFSLV